jgi:tetratricopeptide (TPR) repeat protein
MKTLTFTAIFFLFAACALFADVVHMTDGRKLKGKVISETDDYVLLKGKYGEVNIKRHEIDRIEYGPVEEDAEKGEKEEKPAGPAEKQAPAPKTKPQVKKQVDLADLADKAAKGDAAAAKKLADAKRAALVPIAKKLEKAEGEEKERLEKLRDGIEEKTQEDKVRAAELYAEAKKLLEEATALQKGLGANPTQEQLSKGLELIESMAQKLLEALDLDPTRNDLLEAVAKTAILYYNSGQYKKAIPLLEALRVHAPDNADVLRWLVSSYINARRNKDAKKLLEEILEKSPDNAVAWANMGKVHHEEKKYSKAVECLEKAISLGLKDADTYNYLGMAHREKKDTDKAIENFEKCLEIDEKHANALAQLGALYANKGEYTKAADTWEKFCKLYPKSQLTESFSKEVPKLRKKAQEKK